MDYSNLSDFDINKMVGDVVFKGLWSCRPGASGNQTDSWYYGNADASFYPLSPLPDYCNNPADAWPIISKNRISIVALEGEWGARAYDCIDRVIDANPLRAAMVVYLLTKESANVPTNPARPDIR